MVEGLALARALWTGKPVEWNGRWKVAKSVLGPTPHRPGGPPIWIGGSVAPARERTGRLYDGWFPNSPTPRSMPVQWAEVQAAARAAGRDPGALTGAMYLTLAMDDDAARADARIDAYLEHYYGPRPDEMRKRQMCYAGPAAGAAEWLKAMPMPASATWCCASPATTSAISRRWRACGATSVGSGLHKRTFRSVI